MSDITLEGVVYHVPYRSSKNFVQPRVFIDKKYHDKLKAWIRENDIKTNIQELPHPISGKPCLQIQAISPAKNIKNGTQVKIIESVKKYKRNGKPDHIGLKTLSIESR